MFKATIKVKKLKKFIDAISVVSTDITLKITKNGIYCKSVSPDRIAAVIACLPKTVFDYYNTTEPEKTISIDSVKLKRTIDTADDNSNIKLNIDDNANRLDINVNNLHYTILLTSLPQYRKCPKLNDLKFTALVFIKGIKFKRIVKAAYNICDIIRFEIKNNTLHIESDDNDLRLTANITKDQLTEIYHSDNVKSVFTMMYLIDMIKPVKSSDKVMLEFANDYPMKITFSVSGGNNNISYIIAPTVE